MSHYLSTHFLNRRRFEKNIESFEKIVNQAREELQQEEQQRNQRICNLVKARLNRGEIGHNQLADQIKKEKNKLWIPQSLLAKQFKEWENKECFPLFKESIVRLVQSDPALEEVTLNQDILNIGIREINNFLDKQSPIKQLSILKYTLDILSYQHLVVKYQMSNVKCQMVF